MRRRTLSSIAAIGTTAALAIGLVIATPGVASAFASPSLFGWGSDSSGQISDASDAIGEGHLATISVSGTHVVGLLTDGSVVEWGGSGYGTTLASAMGSSVAIRVAAGPDYGLALLDDGSIVGWGNDTAGVLSGIPDAATAGTVTEISASGTDALALSSTGKVLGWGADGNGQADTQQFTAGTVKQILSAGSSSFAVMNDGSVNAWGFKPSTQDAAIGAGGIASIAASTTHDIALKTDGTAVAWGFDLGGTVASCLAGAIPSGETATAVAAGTNFSELLLSDGTVSTCGDNTTITAATSSLGAASATGIAAGYDTAFALAVPPRISIDNAEDISAGTIAPGARLNIQGSFFRPNLTVVESIDGTQYATGSIDVNGDLGTYDALPSTLTTGIHTLTVNVGGQVLTFTLHIAVGFTTATPTITGTAKVGSDLTAHPGIWATDTSFSYQWFRSGKAIPLVIANDYQLAAADAGKKITVKVTGTPHGFPSTVKAATKTSASTAAVATGDLSLNGSPLSLSGSATVGTTESVYPGNWTPGQASFGYQWFANGVAIKGATKVGLVIPGSVAGKRLTVVVTVTTTGYTVLHKTVGPSPFVALGQIDAGNAIISGTAVVGSKVSLSAPAFGTGVTSSYQWMRDDTLIPGATSSSYTVTTADWEHQLNLVVTGYELGYEGAEVDGGPTGKVMTATLPTITGTGTVGSTLTANPGTWTAGVGLKFEWLRVSGKTSTVVQSHIYSGTGPSTMDTYALVADDKGKTIEVRVTGMQGGYDSPILVSRATKKIA